MTFSRRHLLVGSTALGLGAIAACSADESASGTTTTELPAESPAGPEGGSASQEAASAVAAGRPEDLEGVVSASTLLALGDGRTLRLSQVPDAVELVDHGATLWRTAGTGSGPGQFERIGGAAPGAEGSFWIVDSGNRRVQVLSAMGDTVKIVGAPTPGSTPLQRPIAVAVAPDGRSYVADAARSGVVPFSADGAAGELIGGFGSEHAFAGVTALEVAADELVVVEALAPRVQVYDLGGQWVRTLELPEHFAVVDMAVDGEQVYFVSHDGRLVRTTLDGATNAGKIEQLGHVGSHAGGLHLSADGLVVAAHPTPAGMYQ